MSLCVSLPEQLCALSRCRVARQPEVIDQAIIEVPQGQALPAPFDPTVDLVGHLPNGPY
jgi:hypothetical protein